ncbi:MAG TPA: hypothetical protein VKC61_01135 [Pyrinomonadaceae bacterium]|nr:hypothetical protein [Pyrinomonadaceae bacterium]
MQLNPHFLFNSLNGDLIIDADEIDWIEADDYHAAIHARAGRHLIRESLASLGSAWINFASRESIAQQ